MNYKKLSNLQAELDKHIGQSKGIEMPDYQLERIIALQVEFGELLNELPFLFKYWSNRKMDINKALFEYVDGLHFLLSIGNDLSVKEYEYKQPTRPYDMRVLVLGIANMISVLPHVKDFYNLMDHYLLLGEKLGFSHEQIEKAYLDKKQINFERQNNGY